MLAERRAQLLPPYPSKTDASPLITAITSRLWLAIVRWALRSDLLATLPPGLELFAIAPVVTSGFCPCIEPDTMISCNAVLTATQLLPLLDTALSDYDSLREGLWLIADRVVQLTDPHGATPRRSDRAAAALQARESLDVTGPALDQVFAVDCLQLMEPGWLHAWGLQLTKVEVRVHTLSSLVFWNNQRT
jgi:hypothetical protein